jgi:hypothetical protein
MLSTKPALTHTKNEMVKTNALVIQEAIVLLRVEHFQESTSRIPIDTSANLVHLVDQHKWVLSAYSLESLHDLARQRTARIEVSARYPRPGFGTYPT